MFVSIDLTQEEVDPPHNRWCACGHIAPEMYKRSGINSISEPTKFFKVFNKNINAIYCEPCLVIAHWLSQKR